MKASEVITRLQELISQYGDLPCAVWEESVVGFDAVDTIKPRKSCKADNTVGDFFGFANYEFGDFHNQKDDYVPEHQCPNCHVPILSRNDCPHCGWRETE